jgi:hypothetical protein
LDQQKSEQLGKGIKFKYYSNNDDLIQRLNLLCGSKEAGNNRPEVRTEIVSM